TKTKELPTTEIPLWSEGAIGLELRMPKSTVHSIIVKYRLSNTVENLPRNGRPKNTMLMLTKQQLYTLKS
uniref:Uncharacterized protein n=1 Tax=Xiphophorus couchianus TaxID=32473 RepID=A0A3B5KM09_9TELE